MSEGCLHRVLVNLIIGHLDDERERRRILDLRVDNSADHLAPDLIGSRRPDVYATIEEHGKTYYVMGEAERSIDGASKHQLSEFIERVHNEILIRLIVAVPSHLESECFDVVHARAGEEDKITVERVTDGTQHASLITLRELGYEETVSKIISNL